MKDPRRHFFFWMGVFVLPLFWSWFTLAKGFTVRQRFLAFVWLGISVLWMWRQRLALNDQWEMVSFAYPVILGWVTISLGVWLFFRVGVSSCTWVEAIVLLDLLACIHPPLLFIDLLGKSFHWEWVVPLGVIVLGHLALEPVRRMSRGKDEG